VTVEPGVGIERAPTTDARGSPPARFGPPAPPDRGANASRGRQSGPSTLVEPRARDCNDGEMDASELRALDRDECRTLLQGASLGRVAVTVGALPAIFPINYALLDGDVVFRTAPGTKLCAATVHRVVAFEADGVAPDFTSGWSVLAVGEAAQIRHPATLERAQALGLRPWAPGQRDYFVKIRCEELSGRAFGAGGD
jgi:uncharacterized protein